MKKNMLFEAIIVLMLIVLAFILYVMVTSNAASSSNGWTLSGLIGNTGYSSFGNMFIGNDGTLYTVDGKNVHAVNPDGQVRWSREIPYLLGGNAQVNGVGNVEAWRGEQAVTDNGTLYIELTPAKNNVIAMELLAISPNGKLLWGNGYVPNRFPKDMDTRNGRLYVRYTDYVYTGHISVFNAKGNESTIAINDAPAGLFQKAAPNYNITYTYEPVSAINASTPSYFFPTLSVSGLDSVSGYIWHSKIENAMINESAQDARQMVGNRTLDQLDTLKISAYDTEARKDLWNYTLPIEKHTVIVNESNYKDILIDHEDIEKDNMMSPAEWYKSNNVTYGAEVVNSWASACLDAKYILHPTKDILYVNFWTYNYEVPTFFGISKCTYAGGIYAIDRNGTLLWSKTTDSRVSAIQENNGTIYYGTQNGKISATRIDGAAGFALTALLYLFIRFFLAGLVTRARGRISDNKNRNRILEFIANNPGMSLYDISTRLKINTGTLRYHLMILHVNHRIVSYRADDKYVRYFTNAGSYSSEQQLIISLARRSSIKKVLNKLLEKPGLSNMELAKEIGVQDSGTIRQMKELLAKGIIVKDQNQDGKIAYSIKSEYKEQIASIIERLNGC